MIDHSTIAAVSTPLGKGGISVIRVSGPEAVPVSSRVFHPGTGSLETVSSNHMVHGRILSREGLPIDDGMAVVFREPKSFTGEDTVEISCHGGMLLTQTVLEALIAAGAAPAGKGEFTKRAFLNGKLDLTQAEAIIDLIDAESTAQLKVASQGIRGVLSEEIGSIYQSLQDAAASIYAFIDFPDEDLTDYSSAELLSLLEEVSSRLESLSDSYRFGKAVCEGIRTVIVGRPNVGKSSLLNALLQRDRAIVTSVPGTTRDTIEESLPIGEITLRLCDTAGIRLTDDPLEQMGIERARRALDSSELVLAVFDSSEPANEDDRFILRILKESAVPALFIRNKCDLPDRFTGSMPPLDSIPVSAVNGTGLEKLKEEIQRLFLADTIHYDGHAILTNARQFHAVARASEHVSSAISALKAGYSQDISCMDIESALSDLSDLSGRQVTEEIVDSIFHRFCIGK
ncbi:MAG: tRNA uridine-5-carboxymethylaminomethyl(34) synthesis GTPase MnmE [Candidatus Methanomethylophilaceae archaeon]|nr:tRNA uridine-5-carboxymethylaminomethyl(34) synthesis GTPase MnmE [Candidatus Methanomethylophilaceae archaeon]